MAGNVKLAHFEATEHVLPHVSGLERPTKAFRVGADDVRAIDTNPSGTLVVVRRKGLPDLVFTPMGYGVAAKETE